jgi:hypothetical protein
MSDILPCDVASNSIPFRMSGNVPAIETLTEAQKQIREACTQLAENVKNWALGSYAYLFKSSRLHFLASPEMVLRVEFDDELASEEINEQAIAIYLVLTRASRAPKSRDICTSIDMICGDISEMLVAKNKAYGNSALSPIRKFSKASSVEQILVRIDDKLSRLVRGQSAGEDVEKDLIGYLVLLQIARGQNVE